LLKRSVTNSALSEQPAKDSGQLPSSACSWLLPSLSQLMLKWQLGAKSIRNTSWVCREITDDHADDVERRR
jgi:hypothetical protein